MHRPGTVAAAVKLLGAAEDGRALAGGQSLLPAMKLGLNAPTDMIDLSGIPGLRGITVEANRVRIGAMTRHAEVAASPEVHAAIPALAAMADRIGDTAIRNRGTLGGSLANNDPAACYPAAALALGATLHTDRRDIAADDFFLGVYMTALQPDELITSVSFPVPLKAAYVKFEQPASHFALVGVCVAQTSAGVRVAVTGAGACVFRVEALETALALDFSAEACRAVRIDPEGLNADLHASAAYRAHLIPVIAARAVAQAG
ncbi:MAG: FAD binding domain-containing protein [Burkholderiales bacterium]|nr:MAG: FAD binding domain-containing protein [Burkholderiales bacterium]